LPEKFTRNQHTVSKSQSHSKIRVKELLALTKFCRLQLAYILRVALHPHMPQDGQLCIVRITSAATGRKKAPLFHARATSVMRPTNQ